VALRGKKDFDGGFEQFRKAIDVDPQGERIKLSPN
jgi:hypothetical protein